MSLLSALMFEMLLKRVLQFDTEKPNYSLWMKYNT